ncbi:hypothetical protein MBLNU457_g3042t1 [Dothideomycetes sp. NU457]
MRSEEETANYEAFRDCLSELVLAKLSNTAEKRKKVKGRKNEIKPVTRPAESDDNAAEELGEFIDYLANEMFATLPDDLRCLKHGSIQNDNALAEKYSVPLDTAVYDSILDTLSPTVEDSLISYSLLLPSMDMGRMLEPVFTSYIATVASAPPEHTPTTRASECEICDRQHLPLTYHHLIPRQMHAKAVKRGWAKEWELQKVAWLCRACHSFVHRIASNEELAKELNSVDKLIARDDVQSWAKWVGRIRWKKT